MSKWCTGANAEKKKYGKNEDCRRKVEVASHSAMTLFSGKEMLCKNSNCIQYLGNEEWIDG